METSLIMITLVTGVLSQIVKKSLPKFTTKDLTNFIPIVSILFGVILSIICYFTGFLYVGDGLFESIIYGVIAATGMTGLHQVPTQIRKYYQNISNDHNDVESMTKLIDLIKIIIDGVVQNYDNKSIETDENDDCSVHIDIDDSDMNDSNASTTSDDESIIENDDK